MPRVIRSYLFFQVFFNLLLWIPVFYEIQKRFGLPDGQIFGIQSIYYVAFCLLEIPTGLVADRFGYRFSVRLGAVTLVAANLLPLVAHDYAGFLAHFLLIALARSLVSGAGSAFLYEYLKEQGEVGRYKQVEGDGRFWSLVARVVAWTSVGWLMSWELTAPYWVSAVNSGVALVCVLGWPKLAVTRGSTGKKRDWGSLRRGVLSPLVLLLMAQGVGLFVLARILQVNLYQPLLGSKGLPVTAFGWVMSLMSVFEAVGAKLSPRLRRFVPDVGAVTGATLALCGSLVLLAVAGSIGAVIGMCAFSLATGLAFPVQRQVMNDAITDSSARATILSVESIMDRAICAVAVLPLGGFVAAGDLRTPLLAAAGITAAVAVTVQLLQGRLRRAPA